MSLPRQAQGNQKTSTYDHELNTNDPRVPSPSPSSQPGVFSGLSASASSLLSSLSNPSTPSVTESLASSNTTSSKSGNTHHPSSGSSSHPPVWAQNLLSRTSSTSSPSTSGNDSHGLRNQKPSQLHSPEDEFTSFAKSLSASPNTENLSSTVTSLNGYAPVQDITGDGLDVLTLLSQPLASEIYFLEPASKQIHGINTNHPVIRSFASCDDPIEFLSITDLYTEEVWGDYVGVMQQARQEVLDDKKGKGKQNSNRTAIARLRMIWSHLKGVENARLA